MGLLVFIYHVCRYSSQNFIGFHAQARMLFRPLETEIFSLYIFSILLRKFMKKKVTERQTSCY